MSPDSESKVAEVGSPAAMRRPYTEEDLRLSAESQAFLSSLTDSVRPNQLAERYPRIVNKMATLWRRPTQMDQYFDELLIDKRGNRQGFPLGILMEIITLKEHYQSAAFPVGTSVWDGATNGSRRF
jgi:hypothetical protein